MTHAQTVRSTNFRFWTDFGGKDDFDHFWIFFSKNSAGDLHYKTFYDRNQYATVISQSVCHCPSLPPCSNIYFQGWSLSIEDQAPGFASKYQTRVEVTNTLAYNGTELVAVVKSFMKQDLFVWTKFCNCSPAKRRKDI